ncbi:nuclear hormone receptor HR96 [Plutella xylostella]|uniref:nuclear hormone receptor HR96 n=1 Tax=Plutella xylostella TaxID=51655 RepID=UPI0020330799|nr:nuclear hormone receptor HR96 [Plutella xylostella]
MSSVRDSVEEKKEDSAAGKKELPPNLQKICLVCGDKALGYNFNAISCESCKAFFRRNALASKEFKCPFTNNCDITVVTRRFCQKCRLVKCLSIGMVKEFIMSEEDKAEKRKKIEENRAKKRHCPSEPVTSSKNFKLDDEVASTSYPQVESSVQYDVLSTTCSSNGSVQSPLRSDVDTSIHSPPVYSQYVPVRSEDYTYPVYSQGQSHYLEVGPVSEKSMPYDGRLMEPYSMDSVDCTMYEKQNSIKSILTTEDTVLYREPQHVCEKDAPPAPADPHANKAREILEDVQRIEPNSIESILCEAIKLEFEAYTSVTPCSGSSRELNEVERAKLNELIVANKTLHAPIDDDVSQFIAAAPAAIKGGGGKHDPELIKIVNLTAIAIRRLIKMAKKINAFKNMCEKDQVALLKGGCTEMMLLRSTMNYDTQRNSWKIPHSSASYVEQYGHIRTDILKLAKGNIYQVHESFQQSFDQRWRQDENIILIMSAILLFTPDRLNVVHKDVIKLEQNSYYYLLRRYLESIYAGCEAKSTFLKLIQKILELHKLADEVTSVYLDVNPIEPLLMEIFDLKHHTGV